MVFFAIDGRRNLKLTIKGGVAIHPGKKVSSKNWREELPYELFKKHENQSCKSIFSCSMKLTNGFEWNWT